MLKLLAVVAVLIVAMGFVLGTGVIREHDRAIETENNRAWVENLRKMQPGIDFKVAP